MRPEVVKINNARVVAEEYMSAIGVRNGKLDIDNIVISYEDEQPDPTEAPEETTAPTANASTEKPDTTSTVKPAATNAPQEEEPSDSGWILWAVIAAAAVVAIILIITVIVRKKNKNREK